MSARAEVGGEYDINFAVGAGLATDTGSQFNVCYISASNTVAKISTTATARSAFGIVQSYQSSGSAVVSVRRRGLSRAVCGASVAAGDWVTAYEGISTTTHYGHVQALATGASITAATASVSAFRVVLGQALEAGSTNGVITIDLQPIPVLVQNIGET